MKKGILIGCISIMLVMGLLVGTMLEKGDSHADVEGAESEVAIRYLEEKGYEIVADNGKLHTYVLDRDRLLTPPYSHLWGLQDLDPENYIGETVDVYQVILQNHPLDEMVGNDKEQTIVNVMVVREEVIGGYAFPDYDEQHYGGVYSLEGKTLEEVTGLSFQEWRTTWESRYR